MTIIYSSNKLLATAIQYLYKWSFFTFQLSSSGYHLPPSCLSSDLTHARHQLVDNLGMVGAQASNVLAFGRLVARRLWHYISSTRP